MSKLSDRHYKEKHRKKRLDRFRKFLKIWRLMLLKMAEKKQHWNLCTAVKDRKYGYRCERKGNQ